MCAVKRLHIVVKLFLMMVCSCSMLQPYPKLQLGIWIPSPSSQWPARLLFKHQMVMLLSPCGVVRALVAGDVALCLLLAVRDVRVLTKCFTVGMRLW